jgi:ABC-2 type transport system ATP-binding protein
MEQMLEAEGLRKRYGKVEALAGLTLSAPAGGVLAVLGPNGAGKTTFVRMMATLTRPDAGTLRVAGVDAVRDPKRVRPLIGLAGRENLEIVARLFGQPAADARRHAAETLERLGLTEAADRLVRGWSGGMRRRLDLGASLVGRPRILLLDEPTTGLDPASRIALWEAVRDLVDGGTDVVLTTQYLDEADHLADRIVIIDHGRVIAAGTPGELKSRAGRDVIEAQPRDRHEAPAVARALAAVAGDDAHVDDDTGRVTVPIADGTAGLAEVVRILDGQRLTVDDLALRRPTLDEVFLALTGHLTDRKAS